jgi:hypothetical protein
MFLRRALEFLLILIAFPLFIICGIFWGILGGLYLGIGMAISIWKEFIQTTWDMRRNCYIREED